MIVVLSGEGISDLGACNNQIGECRGEFYVPGPLVVAVDGVIATCLDYSPLEVHPETYRYYSESFLAERLKERKRERRGFVLAGKKHGQETGLFYSNAWMLGEVAKKIELEEGDVAVAILFRDADGTNSAPNDLWERKLLSIEEGFKRAEFERGIPMLPRPKSESWFLCAIKPDPYQHCAALENMPGNDNSPNAAKTILAEALGGEATSGALSNWLNENQLNLEALAEQMPSFAAFYEKAKNVFRALN
ncbi:hypothetical protein [Pseudomonas asiatica]|uniref:hypothetical protein n=1 Tax=Pseudomonas asiatica TaxID=2219225 RepID=UPI003457C1C7